MKNMSLRLLFNIFFGMVLISPAMAQAPAVDQSLQLHQELREAVKSGDRQKADQLRAQLISLQKQQFAPIKKLFDQLREAVKNKDQVKIQQLNEQIREQLMPMMPRNMSQRRGPRMNEDPQSVTLHQELRDAINSNDKQKADQLRAQLISLNKQRIAQKKQLFDDL
jgi:DNA-binding FadR family transcriptional regulator